MLNRALHQLTGQNLGSVFNSRSGCVQAVQIHCWFKIKQSNLKLKTQDNQLLGSLLLDDSNFRSKFVIV
jgi:hypothetical protein